MWRRALVLAFLLALGGLSAWLATPDAHRPAGTDFTLQSAAGPVALHDLRGNVVILYFGYASCPDVCPTSLALLGAALQSLTPAELEHVRPLFISVDPERDTPEKLGPYAAFFDPHIVGVTGDPALLADIGAAYGVTWRKHGVEGNAGYVVDHTSHTVIIGPDGKVAEVLEHGTAPDLLAAAIRARLPKDP